MAGTIDVGTIKVGGLKELKAELRAITGELLNATDPERMQQLAEKAGELKDRIGDANEQVKVFASGSKFEQINNSFGSLKDSIMNLDFEEAAQKAKTFQQTVTSISPETISKGIQGLTSTVGTLGKTFVQFGVMLLANPIFLLVAAITAIVVGIGALMNAFGLLKPIMNAIGAVFGWLSDLIGFLVQGIKDFLDWLGLTSFAADEEAEASKKRAEEEKKRQEALRVERERVFNLQQNAMQREIDLAKAAGKDTEELEKKKIQASINYQKQKLKELQTIIIGLSQQYKLEQLLVGNENEAGAKMNEVAKQISDSKESILNSENELKIMEATKLKERQDKRNEAAKERREKQNEEYKKLREDMDENLKAMAQLEEDYRRSLLTTKEQELLEVDDKYLKLRENAIKYGQDVTKLDEAYNGERAAINKKFDEEEKKSAEEKEADRVAKYIAQQDALDTVIRELEYKKLGTKEAARQKEKDDLNKWYEDQLALAKGNADLEKQLREQQQSDLNAINDKYRQEDLDAQKETNKKKLEDQIALGNQVADWTKEGLTVVNDLVSAFAGKSEAQQKRAFEFQKKTNIAMAIIDTLKGGVAAYMSQIVAGDPTSVVRGAIAAAMVVAAGIANVKKIASTQFGATGTSGATGGSSTGATGGVQPATPQTNLFGQSNNMNTLSSGQSVEANKPQIIKAFVVESDMTNTQNRVKQMENNATL